MAAAAPGEGCRGPMGAAITATTGRRQWRIIGYVTQTLARGSAAPDLVALMFGPGCVEQGKER